MRTGRPAPSDPGARAPEARARTAAPAFVGVYAPPAGARPSAGYAPDRVRVAGKFLALGDEKFVCRGVTYGTFRPRADGCDYPEPAVVAGDFAAMARAGSTRCASTPCRRAGCSTRRSTTGCA
jgi:hypothetical protein